MNQQTGRIKTKEMLLRDLKVSKINLLLAAIIAVVNVILIVTSADLFFFFSLSIPVYVMMLFTELCGMYPAEWYLTNYGEDWEAYVPAVDPSMYAVAIVIAVIFVAAFALLAFFINKKAIWAKVTLGLLIFDTVALLFFNVFVYAFSASALLELAFHAWMIYYAVLAIKAWKNLEVAPSQAELAAQATLYGGNPYGGNPYGGNPYGVAPLQPTVPADEAPVDEMPEEKAPAEDEKTSEADAPAVEESEKTE